MNYSEGLYALVDSLTKTEKRYFRIFAKANKAESNLLKLFDAITVRGMKNDREIKAFFGDHSFVKHFDVVKVHLQKLVLQSMRLYNQNRNRERALRDMIIDIQFLLDKQLYSYCVKLIKKAKVLAEATDNYFILIEIIELEKKLAKAAEHITIKSIDLYKEEAVILKKLKVESQKRLAILERKIIDSKD
ncbi:MAG: hypothetical protein ACHQFW_01460 [Chitinophagales bacterium]